MSWKIVPFPLWLKTHIALYFTHSILHISVFHCNIFCILFFDFILPWSLPMSSSQTPLLLWCHRWSGSCQRWCQISPGEKHTHKCRRRHYQTHQLQNDNPSRIIKHNDGSYFITHLSYRSILKIEHIMKLLQSGLRSSHFQWIN